MPVYEYRCSACGERFDRLATLAERQSARCPRCESTRVERLLSPFAVGRPQPKGVSGGPCGSGDCACRAPDA